MIYNGGIVCHTGKRYMINTIYFSVFVSQEKQSKVTLMRDYREIKCKQYMIG